MYGVGEVVGTSPLGSRPNSCEHRSLIPKTPSLSLGNGIKPRLWSYA